MAEDLGVEAGGSEEGGNECLKNNRFLNQLAGNVAHSKRCRFTPVECDTVMVTYLLIFFIFKNTLIRKRLKKLSIS